MSVKWFTTSRSHGDAAYQPYRLIFTEKPKGIRFNAALTKRLLALQMNYVRIGIEQNRLIVQPMASDAAQDAFKLIANKNSGQICSAAIGDWAAEQQYTRARLRGEWNDQEQGFVFDLTQAIMDDGQNGEAEIENGSGWLDK